MLEQYYNQLNIIALAVSGAAYWILGLLWFTVFGKRWQKEVEAHGIKIEKPSGGEMAGMMIATFIYAIVVSFAISYLVFASQTNNAVAGLKLGALVGGCISAATMGITYIWEKRSYMNLVIDAGYHIFGAVLSAVILASWH